MITAQKNEGGQTLIGVLVALAILVILAQALFTLTNTSYRLVSYNRSRITARHIAQDKLEFIRNLPYNEIGTVGGIPAGDLLQSETVNQNGLSFTVTTSIVYVDDPFDDQAPVDTLPIDYKRVRVDVSWEGLTGSRNAPVVLVTDIAPQGIETTEGGGTLSILVFDANGIAVPQADVTIQAASTSPAVDIQTQTNDNGRIVLPGAPECTECYYISVTKDGYSTDRTYSVAEVENPDKPYQSIIDGQITEISFAIDITSTLNITSTGSRESGFAPQAGTNFTLRGQKVIGTDSNDLPVYKYDEELVTDGTGAITVEDLEWDNYSVILPANSGSVLSGTNPIIPYLLLPNTIVDLAFATDTQTANSVLTIFTDGTDPVASVSATLSQGTFSESKFTGDPTDPDYGQAFFSGLDELSHDIEATASGFLDYTNTLNISGNTTEPIILTAQ